MKKAKTPTVESAKQVATQFNIPVLVITGFDPKTGIIHTATYGQSAENKITAATLGSVLCKAAGGDVKKSVFYEDFRTGLDAARFKELIEHVESSLDKDNDWGPLEWEAWNKKAKEIVTKSKGGVA